MRGGGVGGGRGVRRRRCGQSRRNKSTDLGRRHRKNLPKNRKEGMRRIKGVKRNHRRE